MTYKDVICPVGEHYFIIFRWSSFCFISILSALFPGPGIASCPTLCPVLTFFSLFPTLLYDSHFILVVLFSQSFSVLMYSLSTAAFNVLFLLSCIPALRLFLTQLPQMESTLVNSCCYINKTDLI